MSDFFDIPSRCKIFTILSRNPSESEICWSSQESPSESEIRWSSQESPRYQNHPTSMWSLQLKRPCWSGTSPWYQHGLFNLLVFNAFRPTEWDVQKDLQRCWMKMTPSSPLEGFENGLIISWEDWMTKVLLEFFSIECTQFCYFSLDAQVQKSWKSHGI